MSRDIVLENRQRYRPFEATLYHSVCCRHGECFCSQQEVTGPGGAPNLQPQRVERSFWIAPRGFSGPLPEAVLNIPQVKAARASGYLRVAGEDIIDVIVVPGRK